MQTFGIILIVIAGISLVLSGIILIAITTILKNDEMKEELLASTKDNFPQMSDEDILVMVNKIKTVCGTILLIALVCLGGGIAMVCTGSNNSIKIK